MSFADLLDRFAIEGDTCRLDSIEGWLQGRTLYGGAATMLAYVATTRLLSDLPPLRSAQVDFIAPISSALTAQATELRRGRNVVQAESRISCDGQLAHRATWIFGNPAQDPNATHAAETASIALPPQSAEPIASSPHAPQFLGQFDMRKVSVGADRIAIRRWVRNRAPGALDAIGEAIGCGDALPPGSLKAMRRPGPLSSMSWSFTVIDPAPTTRDGWWLVESASEFASQGYSGERLRLWNSDGQLVLSGQQSVAIFG